VQRFVKLDVVERRVYEELKEAIMWSIVNSMKLLRKPSKRWEKLWLITLVSYPLFDPWIKSCYTIWWCSPESSSRNPFLTLLWAWNILIQVWPFKTLIFFCFIHSHVHKKMRYMDFAHDKLKNVSTCLKHYAFGGLGISLRLRGLNVY